MVGDKETADITGAHETGMTTVLYNPEGKKASDLADFVISHFSKPTEIIP